jgi:hypothetical protein
VARPPPPRVFWPGHIERWPALRRGGVSPASGRVHCKPVAPVLPEPSLTPCTVSNNAAFPASLQDRATGHEPLVSPITARATANPSAPIAAYPHILDHELPGPGSTANIYETIRMRDRCAMRLGQRLYWLAPVIAASFRVIPDQPKDRATLGHDRHLRLHPALAAAPDHPPHPPPPPRKYRE